MIINIYSIFDGISLTYGPVFGYQNEMVALRDISNMVNKPSESPIHSHPADFVLVQTATFDDASGTTSAFEEPQRVLNLSKLVEKPLE